MRARGSMSSPWNKQSVHTVGMQLLLSATIRSSIAATYYIKISKITEIFHEVEDMDKSML